MKLKIRHKLAIWMLVVGVIPAFVASRRGVTIIADRFTDTLQDESEKNLRVGINVAVDHINIVKNAAITLSKKSAMVELATRKDLSRQDQDVIRSEFAPLGNGVIHVVDIQGKLSGSISLGDQSGLVAVKNQEQSFEALLNHSVPQWSNMLKNYAITLNLYSWEGQFTDNKKQRFLFIQAGAPLFDQHYNLLGGVIVTVALDDLFCKNISTILGSQIILYPSSPDLLGTFSTSFENPQDLSRPVESPLGGGAVMTAWKSPHGRYFHSFTWNDMEYAASMQMLHDIQGRSVGLLVVALDITKMQKGKSDAVFTLMLSALLALAVVIVLATWFSRNLANPLGRLLRGAREVASGKLDERLEVDSGDEIGELAEAFNDMIQNLQESNNRQNEQMSEIQTLNEIINAMSVQVGVSSVISEGLEAISVALQTSSAQIWLLHDENGWKKNHHIGSHEKELADLRREGKPLVEFVATQDSLMELPDLHELSEDLSGPFLAVPIRYQGRVIAVVYLLRPSTSPVWTDTHKNVIRAVSEQMGMYIVNAQLFEKISRFNEQLEYIVHRRTMELQETNKKLGSTVNELQNTQAQVLISERLAGLGSLLAGVAHEINSPIGAIDAAVDNLKKSMQAMLDSLLYIVDTEKDPRVLTYLLTLVQHYLENVTLTFPQRDQNRERIREMTNLLTSRNIENARSLSRKLVENGTDSFVENFLSQYENIDAAMYLQLMNELFTIHRTAAATATAIHSVKRIVMALRSYSHVKQDVPEPVNIHDVIETSLIILANRLKHNITIEKRYGDLPPITVYGDELSQVWTNLLSNAAHAIDGQGTIVIETINLGNRVAIKIRDTGRGIPPELIDRIFDPFFTTKKKGEGTGLGLGIVSRIVKERHGGEIEVTSVPGDTCFTVYLPIMVTSRAPEGLNPQV
ncbi:MAG: hypothetical protein CVU59_09650 [Deltaproteobacteria bacterium HGW-Deltaproteobacteria-17]|nr:MAG: hypothetical protein CVU59_09650 [Deltaproteobacteria bacterium HGW-Deltaproteobacteria-17]